jgi:hypothetical protein
MSILKPVIVGATWYIINVKATVPTNPPNTALLQLGFMFSPSCTSIYTQRDDTDGSHPHQCPKVLMF